MNYELFDFAYPGTQIGSSLFLFPGPLMKKKTNVTMSAQQNPLKIAEMKRSLFIPIIMKLVPELPKNWITKLPGGKIGKMVVTVKKPKKDAAKIKIPIILNKVVPH